MNGEPQPSDEGDKLDRALFHLKAMWFTLFSGGLLVTSTLAVIVMSGGGMDENLGDLKYLFLLQIPLMFLGAYYWPPRVFGNPPGLVGLMGNMRGRLFEEWPGTPPDDPFYWFPVYTMRLFMRVGMLNGSAILGAVGFFLTRDWILLYGAAVPLAAVVFLFPTRAAVESCAETARRQRASEG